MGVRDDNCENRMLYKKAGPHWAPLILLTINHVCDGLIYSSDHHGDTYDRDDDDPHDVCDDAHHDVYQHDDAYWF